MKYLFFKFTITGWRRVLKIGFHAQLKLIYYCLLIQNLIVVSSKTSDIFNIACKLVIIARSDLVKCCDDQCLCNIIIFICTCQELVVNHRTHSLLVKEAMQYFVGKIFTVGQILLIKLKVMYPIEC